MEHSSWYRDSVSLNLDRMVSFVLVSAAGSVESLVSEVYRELGRGEKISGRRNDR